MKILWNKHNHIRSKHKFYSYEFTFYPCNDTHFWNFIWSFTRTKICGLIITTKKLYISNFRCPSILHIMRPNLQLVKFSLQYCTRHSLIKRSKFWAASYFKTKKFEFICCMKDTWWFVKPSFYASPALQVPCFVEVWNVGRVGTRQHFTHVYWAFILKCAFLPPPVER